MKIFIISLFLFFTITFSEKSYSQNGSLDDYILDTTYRPSTTDSLVMDTIITAKKRVVVNKEVIIENEILVYQLISDQSIHLYVSRDWYPEPKVEKLSQVNTITYSQAKGISVGGSYQTNIKNKLRLGLSLAYSRVNQNGLYEYLISTPIESNITVTDTIEVYYIGTSSYYITQEVPKVLYDTLYNSAYFNFINMYSNIDIEFDIGKQFVLDYFSLYPRIIVGYRKGWLTHGYYVDNGIQHYNKAIHTNNFRFALSCMISVPIFNNYGIDICPNVYLFNNNKSSVSVLKSENYSLSCGLHYKFN